MSPPSPSTLVATQPPSRKRTIRFASSLCEYFGGASAADANIWLTAAELQQLKRSALQTAKQANNNNNISTASWTHCRRALDPETAAALTAWCRGPFRGLERWIHAEYAAQRAEIRQRTIKSVLRAQRKMQQDARNHEETQNAVPQDPATVLARLSETFSQDARQWARWLGQADAAAMEDCVHYYSGDTQHHNNKTLRRSSPTSVIDDWLLPSNHQGNHNNNNNAHHQQNQIKSQQQKQRHFRKTKQEDAVHDMRHFY